MKYISDHSSWAKCSFLYCQSFIREAEQLHFPGGEGGGAIRKMSPISAVVRHYSLLPRSLLLQCTLFTL